MALGDITGVIDSIGGVAGGHELSSCRISRNVYAVAEQETVKTIGIMDDGTISGIIDTWVYDSVGNRFKSPYIFHVAGDVFGIAYDTNYGDELRVLTLEILSDGTITHNISSGLVQANVSSLIEPIVYHTTGSVYAIVGEGMPFFTAWLWTVEILDNGTVTGLIDTLPNFLPPGINMAFDNAMIHIAGDVYAIATADDPFVNFVALQVTTVGIQAGGTITGVIDTRTLSNGRSEQLDIRHVTGDVYVITGNDRYSPPGSLAVTLTILSDGTISAIIGDLELGDCDGGLVHIGADVFAHAGGQGWLNTFNITDAGVMTLIDTLRYATSWEYNRLDHMFDNVYVIPYCSTLYTVGIDSSSAAAARHHFTGGLTHRPMH